MKKRKNSKKQGFSHNGEIWARLAQIIKVEGPLTWEKIKHWAPDTPALEVDRTLREMVNAGVLIVDRQWEKERMIETYTYR